MVAAFGSAEWVQNEAAEGARRSILVPVMLEQALPPLEFRRKHAADLAGWKPPKSSPILEECLDSVGDVLGTSTLSRKTEPPQLNPKPNVHRLWVLVVLLTGVTVLGFVIGRKTSADKIPLVPYRPPVTCTAATQPGTGGTVVDSSSSCSVPDGVTITRVLLHYTLDDGGEIYVNKHQVFGIAPDLDIDSGTVRLPISIFTEESHVLLIVRARNTMNADGSTSGTVYGRASLEIFTRPRSMWGWFKQE